MFGADLPAATDDFKADAASLIETYTGFPIDWFRGKDVLDAGCGNGRWSWALGTAGATVTAVDQSEAGVAAATGTCAGFPGFRAVQHDLLKPLDLAQEFDLVWSFGVLHHTGDTRTALANVAACVKPGGYLYLMLYGEPRWLHPGEFRSINRYNEMGQTLAPMEFDERAEFLRSKLGDWNGRNWFDAASPSINDLHRRSAPSGSTSWGSPICASPAPRPATSTSWPSAAGSPSPVGSGAGRSAWYAGISCDGQRSSCRRTSTPGCAMRPSGAGRPCPT